MLDITVIRIGPVGLKGEQGDPGAPGSDASVTTAAIVAALAASPPNNAQKLALATAAGFPVHATRDLAEAALPTGRTYFQSTDYVYDTTTA